MPVDMLSGEAVLSRVEPLPASLLIFILLARSMSFLVNMYAIRWYADLILLPYPRLQNKRLDAWI